MFVILLIVVILFSLMITVPESVEASLRVAKVRFDSITKAMMMSFRVLQSTARFLWPPSSDSTDSSEKRNR